METKVFGYASQNCGGRLMISDPPGRHGVDIEALQLGMVERVAVRAGGQPRQLGERLAVREAREQFRQYRPCSPAETIIPPTTP